MVFQWVSLALEESTDVTDYYSVVYLSSQYRI